MGNSWLYLGDFSSLSAKVDQKETGGRVGLQPMNQTGLRLAADAAAQANQNILEHLDFMIVIINVNDECHEVLTQESAKPPDVHNCRSDQLIVAPPVTCGLRSTGVKLSVLLFGPQSYAESLLALGHRYYRAQHTTLVRQIPGCSAGTLVCQS